MSESAGKAVFLSYASQDAGAAKRICEALRAVGVEVWFDKDALVGGDAWDQKIRGQVASCALFVPVVSAATQARREGYFRLEWKLADERTHQMAEGTPFLLPVVIDETKDRDALVPKSFLAVQWTKLPGGETSAAFVARLKKLLGAPISPSSPRSPSPATVMPPPKSNSLVWAVGALSAAFFVLAAYVVLRPGAKDAAPIAKPVAESKPATSPLAPRLSPTTAALAEDKSIAVLPFENLSDDKDNTAFFSDGMHEDILTTLANIPELRVISRTSVMEYRGTTKKIPQIARELGVAYILEGSVRRAGSQIRLTGQLIRAATDEHLWAKSYDRELTPKDIFSIQAALATEIAGALQAAISPSAKKLVERRPTENLAAYDLYLKARSFRVWFLSDAQARERLLREAVGLDPNFAAAWSELATNHAGFLNWGWDDTPKRLAQADAAITHAVKLAPDNPEVILDLGRYAMLGYRDFARAVTQFEKYVQLQPNNADVYFYLGLAETRQGRWPEALGNFRKGEKLEPGGRSSLWLFFTLQAARRWDEAIAVGQRIVARQGDPADRWRLALVIFAATGSTREIDEVVDRLTPAERDSASYIPMRKERAIIRGDFAEWKRLDSLPESEDPNDVTREGILRAAMALAAHGDLAGARARLGNQPEAFRSALERELELQPTNANKRSSLALMEALLGEQEAALRDARKALELEPESKDTHVGPVLRLNLAKVLAWTGDKDRAIAELARVLNSPYRPYETFSVHILRVAPEFAPLRGDPQFEALLNNPKNNAPLF